MTSQFTPTTQKTRCCLPDGPLTSSRLPVVTDTLGWVEHLLGDDSSAQPLERASAGRPGDAEILFHVAVVHAAMGNKAKAKEELDAAEKLNPQLAARADVKALRAIVGSS